MTKPPRVLETTADRPPGRGLHRLACATTAATFVLIIAGGLVTSNEAGLSVPDWPLSFGRLMPEMVGGVFYEHGHRMIAASVGCLTFLLAALLWRSRYPLWLRRLGLAAAAGVVAQGLLGGMTVLLQLPTSVSVLHATLAQTFFALTAVIALATAPGWASGRLTAPAWEAPPVRAALLATAVVYLQLILGAVVRHSGPSAGDRGSELIPAALGLHILGAVVATGAVLFAAWCILRAHPRGPRAWPAYGLFACLALQLFLGIGAFVARVLRQSSPQPLPLGVAVTTSHVAAGALLLVGCLLSAFHLARSSGPPVDRKAEPQLAEGTS